MEDQHPLLEGEFAEPPMPDQPLLKYFVIRQEVRLEVNFRDRRVDGETDIIIVTFDDKIEEVALDAADCDIATDKITITEIRYHNGEIIEGQPRAASAAFDDPYRLLSRLPKSNWGAEHHDLRRMRARSVFYSRHTDVPAENREFEGCTPVYGSLRVNLKNKAVDQDRPRLVIRKSASNLEGAEASSHKQYKITIPFAKTSLRDGLHFAGVDALDNRFPHMYTRHSFNPGTASCIFPCIDDHGCRCDWRISVKYPRTLGDALHQALATQQTGSQRLWTLAEEDKLREMSVICSGFLIEENADPEDESKKIMTFEPEKKVSVQNLGFAVGPFEHIDLSSESRTEEDDMKLGMNALKVHAYSLPHRGDWVRNTAAALTMAADFMTFTFAKYPFGNFKLVFLDDMIENTIPLHSMAFVSNRLLYPEDIIDHEIEVTRQIVYTLTYQWTGINMIPSTRGDLWLVMGLAHFMTDLFMKKLCGNNEYRFRMKHLSDQLVELDTDRPCLYDLGMKLHLDRQEVEFMTLKTSVVLFILDKRLVKASGGHGLTRILQRLCTKNVIDSSDKASVLDTEKFRVTCEKGAKFRLESFWNQWVYGAGCPIFDVKARFNKKRLCVELTLNQTQLQNVKKTSLSEDDFLRLVKERRVDLESQPLQPLFTGPMTIRIHEADGTPYEHILEIREDAARSTKFEIPYNTKYKRLKRTRRMKEKHNLGSSMDLAAENAEDALLYSLGDVLQTSDDLREWELIEWDPETERKMDQESYEWIRVDADFEWACDMKRNLEPYMYVSQLQQDRDVVAQQDAMLYLTHGPLHPIASGFLVRTLIDRRYFHGIRTMAAQALPRQANIKDIPLLGLRQLMRAFREMFCYDNASNPYQPLPNDFSDKKQYNVRCAIIKAVAAVRDSNHRCPLEARRFILDQLLFNNNEENPFSDHHYIALLVESLSISLVPSKKDSWYARQAKQVDEEEKQFLDTALEQIERVLRRDEWTNSYQNVWTIAGLDAKQRLMKAEVIEKNLTDFSQYLLDGTADVVRIKCFEALIDLGAMMDSAFFTFLMYALATDRSPYVRDRLIHSVSRGIAAIAFGEHTAVVKTDPVPDDDTEPLLLVQDSAQEIEARQEMFARKENLESALQALQKEMDESYRPDKRHYMSAMRKALDHKDLGRAEIEDLLILGGMLFEESSDWIMTLTLPKAWMVEKSSTQNPKRLLLTFKSYHRSAPKISSSLSAAAPLEPVLEMPHPPAVARTGSIKINSKTSGQGNAGSTGTVAAAPNPIARPSSVAKASHNSETSSLPPAPSIKRPREDSGSPAPKRAKTEDVWEVPDGVSRKSGSRIVTVRLANTKRLAVALGKPYISPSPGRATLPGAGSRTPLGEDSKVVRKALPGSNEHNRRPLPGSGEGARKPLPGGGDGTRKSLPGAVPSSMSPPPPPRPQASPNPPSVRVKTSASPAPQPSSTPKASPGAATPTSSGASARPKIKIVRKPQPAPNP